MVVFVWASPTYRRPRQDSNPQPSDPKSDALSIELLGRNVGILDTLTRSKANQVLRFCPIEKGGVTN